MRQIGEGLVYRDLITVGVLLSDLRIHENSDRGKKLLDDSWIYIQESDVRVGRLTIYNNFSPAMVADPSNVWVGLEYFSNVGDDLW